MRDADRRKLEEIADYFMDTFMVFSRRVSRGAPHPGAKKFDPSRFVLKKVEELGPIRMSELGRHMEVSKPYMTALVNKLIGEGLVERVTDPRDRRVVMIRITAAGRNEFKEFIKAARKIAIERLSSLDSEDISELRDSMEKIAGIISKLDQERVEKP